MTKKAAALLLAASLAVSVCATPVFATATTPPTMGSQAVNGQVIGNKLSGSWGTHVLYEVTEGYTWTVPVTIDFGADAGVNNTSTVNATLDKDDPGKTAVKDADNKWKGTAPKIVVTKNVIRAGKKLQITVDTDKHFSTSFDPNDGFYVETTDTHEKLYFKIQKNDASKTELTKANNKVLSVPSGTDTAEQELVFTLNTAANNATGNAAEKAGKYEGYVYFSSELVD